MEDINDDIKTDLVIIYVDAISFKLFIAALVLTGVIIGMLINTLCV